MVRRRKRVWQAEDSLDTVVANALVALAVAWEGKALGVTELSERAGLPGTVHRLLTTLQSRGFVRKEDETGKYVLGLRLFEIGMFIANQLMCARRPPTTPTGSWKTPEVVHFVLEDSRVILLDKRVPTGERSNQMIRFHLCLALTCHGTGQGSRPIRPRGWWMNILRLVVLSRLRLPRSRTRRVRGVGPDSRPGLWSIAGFECMSCIGAGFDYPGRVVAAISVSAPTARIAAVSRTLSRTYKLWRRKYLLIRLQSAR